MARKRKAKEADEQNDHDAKMGDKVGSNDSGNQDDVQHFNVSFNDKSIVCERRGNGSKPSLIFTHGAGGGLAAPATKDFADGFAQVASIVSFQGTMNLKSRIKLFDAVSENEGFDSAFGGRSMGARAATVCAVQDDHRTKALVLVSFPLVGGKNNESREQILLDLPEGIDVLFVSGSKDSMCDLEHLQQVMAKMKARSWLIVVEAADHGMSWKWKDSALGMRQLTGKMAAEWLKERNADQRYRTISLDEDAGEVTCSGWKTEGVFAAAPKEEPTKKTTKKPSEDAIEESVKQPPKEIGRRNKKRKTK